MDVYDETNIISSDEYTDEDDDFVNEVIVSPSNKPESIASSSSSPIKPTDPTPFYRFHHHQQDRSLEHVEVKSSTRFPRKIIKAKNYACVYKKKSINWLNNRGRRNKYKQFLLSFKKCETVVDYGCVDGVVSSRLIGSESSGKRQNEYLHSNGIDDIIPFINLHEHDDNEDDAERIGDSINENFDKVKTTTYMAVANTPDLIGDTIEHDTQNANAIQLHYHDGSQNNASATMEITAKEIKDCKDSELSPPTTVVTTPSPITRIASSSNRLDTTESSDEIINSQEPEETAANTSTSFYKDINEMYVKYDETISGHIKSKSTNNGAVDEILSRTLLEIHTLSNILQEKELEWNRLLHLKKVKEEMLVRILRKKNVIELKAKSFGEDQYTMVDLNDLIRNLSGPDAVEKAMSPSTTKNLTAKQLVESRANMKSADLEKEFMDTEKLKSILLASNILSVNEPNIRAETIEYQYNQDGSKNESLLPIAKEDALNITNDLFQNIKHLNRSDEGDKHFSPTLERLLSSAVPSAKNLTNNTQRGLKHIRGKRIVLNDYSRDDIADYSDGCYQRLLNGSNPAPNEVSIIPVTPASCSGNRFLTQKDQRYKVNLIPKSGGYNNKDTEIGNSIASEVLYENKINSGRRTTVPICQECHAHESHFVCGGCGNQWYCSRSCQVSAWDKHSESCIG